ncbi:hypothetical protein [Bradyrhizobium sp. RT3a]
MAYLLHRCPHRDHRRARRRACPRRSTFRSELGKKSFNTLPEYAAEFSEFLERSPRLFPSEIQKSIFLETARSAALEATLDVDGEEDPEKRAATRDALIASRRAKLEGQALPPNIDLDHVNQTIALWTEDLVKPFEEW